MHSWASFQINSRPKNIASYDDKKGRLLQMIVIYVLLCILAYYRVCYRVRAPTYLTILLGSNIYSKA